MKAIRSTPITLSILLNPMTDQERQITVDAGVTLYAGQYHVRLTPPNPGDDGGESLTDHELVQIHEAIVEHCLSYRRDIVDAAIEDLRGYPLGGGSD